MKGFGSLPHRRFLAPEVVQVSGMDCGPAALKCLCEGFGIPVSYGRLREACQTDVDGTSIDTLEEAAVELGLEAEQIMLPADHLFLPEVQALPALVVTVLPNGLTHFVVVWRRHGPLVQLMDPATGRRWVSQQRFLDELYLHLHPIQAEVWRAWAGTAGFVDPLGRRLGGLGLAEGTIQRLVEEAVAEASWHGLAALDAAVRMVGQIARSGGLGRGAAMTGVLEALYAQARQEAAGETPTLPSSYWFVRPGPPGPDGEECLVLRGAVLVRVLGRGGEGEAPSPRSPELRAALEEPPAAPERDLLRLLRADGLLTPAMLTLALLVAAGGIAVEALLFRALFDLPHLLGLTTQRLAAVGALLGFVASLLVLEWASASGLLRLGCRLEIRLRQAFLEKIPRLGDRYFQSRLISDMAERSHSIHLLRQLPELGGLFLRSSFGLALTTAGIFWLDPASGPVAALAALLGIGLPLLAQPLLVERDLRVRNHSGALCRFYLDALLGLVAVRTHGAESAMRREHEGLLGEWTGAGVRLQRAVAGVEAGQSLIGLGLAAWLFLGYLSRSGEAGASLLLLYWALHLPVLGQDVALMARQYPALRSAVLRLLEPLGAPEEREAADAAVSATRSPASLPQGVRLVLEGVQVQAAGHPILAGIDLDIAAGSHVAIVGPSGAGKSSLVGLLLGWHRPAMGQVWVDGAPLDNQRLRRLRRQTAWVDPGVHLWNRSCLDNLLYGNDGDTQPYLEEILRLADLAGVVGRLSEGLQTPLGEGGALLSGGEGQRVRLGRALGRAGVRLAILDEPFRGLDRAHRQASIEQVRRHWSEATLLYITHDVAQTQAFSRVLVVERGRIVEDGDPTVLAEIPGGRYRALLEAEQDVRQNLWLGGQWRRLRLEEGWLKEVPGLEEER